jgi:hypothetical protein
VRELYRLIYGRSPTADELELGVAFLQSAATEPFGGPPPGAGPWQYGYGELDTASGRVREFHPLPHWTGSAWQAGPNLPDPQLGWVLLRADGGHPGDPAHAVVRRWTAPRDGTAFIVGTLKHTSAEGDGVRGVVLSSRNGVLGEWAVHNSEATTRASDVRVSRGDTVDFVADCRTNPGWDGFHWTASVVLRPDEGRRRMRFNSVTDFSGPPSSGLSPLARYAQVLLLSNEFVHVD